MSITKAIKVTNAGWYRWEGDDLVLNLKVQPRASVDSLEEPAGDQAGDELRVRITAPPVDGKANAHLGRFLAKCFGVPPSRVVVISGAQGRHKRVRIRQPERLPTFLPPR